MATIWQLLEELSAHFACWAPSEAAAQQACEAAAQLVELASNQQGFNGDQSRRLER